MPLFVRQGVNRMAGHDWHLLGPVLGILVLAVLRYATVAYGRQLVRLVGVTVTYDMRERLYWHFELQGPRFFARFPTGDLMARAINDLNLVRQLIGVGSRTLIVLGFSGIVAFGFMLFLSLKLTLWLLPVMPFIAGHGLSALQAHLRAVDCWCRKASRRCPSPCRRISTASARSRRTRRKIARSRASARCPAPMPTIISA